MKILLVEDDLSIAEGLIDGFPPSQFEVLHVESGQEGIESLSVVNPDLILLDLGLPDIDGTDVCRAIRAASTVPIIVISARNEEIDRVVALEIGADDYLVKPFGIRELIARIRAVTRRTGGEAEESENAPRIIGPLVLDIRTRKVTLNDTEVGLTQKEFDLVEYLTQDVGAVYKRSDILHDVWDTNWYGTGKTLDAHVASTRKKLGDPGWIESVRGVGFRFGVPQ